jgi:hypothetical protein
MKHVVLFDRLSFQKHKKDKAGNLTIEPEGPEEIVYRGHEVPDYVPDWQRAALANSGMIVAVADTPAPAPVPDLGPVPPAEPVADDVVAPKPTDSRTDWETFAASDAVGMSADEAASYPNKQALIDTVNAKLAQK